MLALVFERRFVGRAALVHGTLSLTSEDRGLAILFEFEFRSDDVELLAAPFG